MALNSARGQASHDGWLVWGDALDDSRTVSTHESIHYWLDRTTSYGALLVTAGHLVDQGRLSARTLRQLRDRAGGVHEASATYLTSLLPATETNELPHHARYRQAMAGIVAACPSAYTRLHAAWAVARACLQPTLLPAIVDAEGTSTITVNELRLSQLPDDRFKMLRRHPPDFAALSMAAARASDIAVDAPELTTARLHPSMLGPDRRPLWRTFAQVMYRGVASVLEEYGCGATL